MPADYGRIHRLLKILMLIQGEPGWTPKRLAVECQTTERNIYRDLKMLQGAGIPYFFDDEARGYAVRKDFFMPAVALTLEESLALVSLAEHIGGKEQVPFTRAASKAVQKIRCNLPQSIQEELNRLDDQVHIQLAAASPPESSQDVYDTVRRAIAERRVLLCRYESPAGDLPDNDAPSNSRSPRKPDSNGNGEFAFQPYALFFGQRAWYAVGYHGGRKAVRCLKLSRFCQCRLGTLTYEIPKDFSLSDHFGNAWRMIRGDQTHNVELRFDREFAETISDTHWHGSQEILWQDDGSILFRCKVDGLDEIIWWILSMGPHCTVLQPPELSQRVRELAEQMIALYPSA